MIKFYFSETFRIFKRSPIASVIVISITTIAILLSSVSFYLIFISHQLSNRVKKNIELVAYLDESIDSLQLGDAKTKIENMKFVSSVKFINKEEALNQFVKDTGENITSVLDNNPLPQSFILKLKPELLTKENIEREVQTIKSVPGISEVSYENEFVIRLLKYIKSGQLIVYAISIILILFSIYLVYVYSRLQFTANENLYRTMKLVGAKLRALKFPILIYGILIGLISGLLSLGINFLFLYLLKTLVINLNFPFVINGVYFISIGMGIVLGYLGSYLSAKRITLFIDE
jgi:cell division transport system permease protein